MIPVVGVAQMPKVLVWSTFVQLVEPTITVDPAEKNALIAKVPEEGFFRVPNICS